MCSHSKNFTIDEISFASHQRVAHDGKCDDLKDGKPFGFNEMLEISHYNFECLDCRKRLRFSALTAEKPAYLKRAIAILFP